MAVRKTGRSGAEPVGSGRVVSGRTNLERLEAEVGEGEHGDPLVQLDPARQALRDGVEHLPSSSSCSCGPMGRQGWDARKQARRHST